MSTVQDIADRLAEDTFKVMERTGDDRFFMEVAKVIGASSTTLEEAYLTAVRVRLAEQRARRFIEERLAGRTGEDTSGL